MKLKRLKIKDFRGYSGECSIDFDDLTAIVGKNDIGKSTILEALDIFFNDGGNDGVIKFDSQDINVLAQQEASLSVCFYELPDHVIIDEANPTTLSEEYLLNSQGYLEIKKKYTPTGKAKIFIIANHPTNVNCNNLHHKKPAELREIINNNGIECEDRIRNATMRKAIWRAYQDELQLEEVEIDISKGEDVKSIWDKLKSHLPIYSLFQADRKNSDGDSEIQDPLKQAVKEILNDPELVANLQIIADTVKRKLEEVSDRTLEKLREMSPDIADNLSPVIPTTQSLKWADVFKNVSISGDESIPINKRGSGVKRLILLNFFRAEAERRQQETQISSIIYAIEEPETSQHSENQKKLVKALMLLSGAENTQVIFTTHSPVIVKKLEISNVRIVASEDQNKVIINALDICLPYPSLNEVNFIAFDEISEEYHDELFGHLSEQDWLNGFKVGKPLMAYNRLLDSGHLRQEQKILSEYIRHLIHHPENTNNPRYTDIQLRESITEMRAFIQQKNSGTA